MKLAGVLAFAGMAGCMAAIAQTQVPQLRASEILGREVTTERGERLAIRDLVIDPVSGKVQSFAVGRKDEPDRDRWQVYPLEALHSAAGGALVLGPEAPSASAGASLSAPASR